MPKGLDGRPHGNVVDCSILADTRTRVLVFGTKTKRASTREATSSSVPFACAVKMDLRKCRVGVKWAEATDLDSNNPH